VAADARGNFAMNDLHWLGAQEIAAEYVARRLSPVELVTALLDRIAKLNPLLGAFVRVDAEAVLDAARMAEREIAAGHGRGPLHGVPIAV
jgi:aspartyl-tRNA(Asn)/glutamyl-tRNA(Gln) amidotransferase subunit A